MTIDMPTACRECKTLYVDFNTVTPFDSTSVDTHSNGKLVTFFVSGGHHGVKDDGTGNQIFYMYPQNSATPSATSAPQQNFTQKAKNMMVSYRGQVNRSTRTGGGNPPKEWENIWLFLKFKSQYKHIYFHLRNTQPGYVFGMKQNKSIDAGDSIDDTTPDLNITLQTSTSTPAVITYGEWRQYDALMLDNHVWIWIDGRLIIDYIIDGHSGSWVPYIITGVADSGVSNGAGGTKIRCTIVPNESCPTPLTTGVSKTITGAAGSIAASLNGTWTLTRIDSTHMDLDASVWPGGSPTYTANSASFPNSSATPALDSSMLDNQPPALYNEDCETWYDKIYFTVFA